MTLLTGTGPRPSSLRCATVLRVQEQSCEVLARGELSVVEYLTSFPTPRVERVAPGNLVALAPSGDGEVLVWRWYDAVVLGEEAGLIRLWEPAHGEVLAASRRPNRLLPSGTRAYLSAGLPGADWWVAGPAVAQADDAQVELDEVERFLAENDIWSLPETS